MDTTATAGVVLDPFSIHATGLWRRHSGTKRGKAADLYAPLHGEAKFKQAFVNACHFAESMTVIGPISQLVWDKSISAPLHHALFWSGDKTGANKEFVDFNRAFMTKHGWTNIQSHMLEDENRMFLHGIPDFSFQMWNQYTSEEFPSADSVGQWGTAERALSNQFGSTYFSTSLVARAKTETAIPVGCPTLGLMAVIFTFKKPTGNLEVFELTNLASWPPVVFLLPVMVPAGTMLGDSRYLGSPEDHIKVVQKQPTMMTYRLSLDTNHLIKPFGQPFNLISVDKGGKTADTLRSLSDVFRALWSEATQYSAWNSMIDFNPDIKADSVKWPISMAMEPMGAGRRIRGHNRYSGMYPMDNVQLLWETAFDEPDSKLLAWATPSSKSEYYRQLRSMYSGKRESIFVLPSYFTTKTAKHLQPLALTLLRFMFNQTAGLSQFVDGSMVNNCDPHTSFESVGAVGTHRDRSFLDRTLKACGVPQDSENMGWLPLHRTTGEIAFDPEGQPTVFGLRSAREQTGILRKPLDDTTDADIKNLVDNVEVLGNFSFLDAFCSKSTRDLTDVFGEVKEKSLSGERGTKARDMMEDTLAVDLFGDGADDLLFSMREALKELF